MRKHLQKFTQGQPKGTDLNNDYRGNNVFTPKGRSFSAFQLTDIRFYSNQGNKINAFWSEIVKGLQGVCAHLNLIFSR